jgi:hypothetical protein
VAGGSPRCDHARVPSEFLPPDPYADAPGEPGFAPPSAPRKADGHRAVPALGCGAASLGLLALTNGLLFFVTLPASIAGWVLGAQARRHEGGRDQANVAVIMGIVGTVASLICAGIWIAIWT